MTNILDRLIRARPVRNAVSMYVLMFGGHIIPLIILPYILRTLGPEGYGRVAFAHSFVAFLIIAVNYGFDWATTREIAKATGKSSDTSDIASTVWMAKSLLALICMIIGAVIVWVAPPLYANRVIIAILYTEVVREVLNPKWAFRGYERMGFLPLITFGCRLIEVVAILLFVTESDDVLVYAWIIAGRSLLVGIVGAIVALSIFDLKLSVPRFDQVWDSLRQATLLFLSSASEQVMRNSTTFLLGIFGGSAAVGIYRPVEQVIRAGVRILDPLSQAVFPWLSRMTDVANERFLLWARRLVGINLGMGLLMTVVVLAGSELGISLLMGETFQVGVVVAMVLGLIPLMIAVSKSTGIQMLLPLGHDRRFTIAQGLGLVSLILLAVGLVRDAAIPEVTMAISLVVAEGVVALTCAVQARSVLVERGLAL